MKDEEFIQRFEECTLPKENFHHRDHVRLAWLYLRDYPALEALARFCDRLKRFAAAHGKTDLYHETITWAYLFLIRERMARGEEESWEEFAEHNPDILNWEDSIIKTYYQAETIKSDLAKRIFVFPDLCAKTK